METARELARDSGLAGLSLRDLARHLGMAAPSLYSYFASKDALYDAMFAQGYREMLALPVAEVGDLRAAMRAGMHRFVQFCVEDPVRYQLLFQRPIPGFTPSPESYALATQAYERDLQPLAAFGITDQGDLDLVTAVFSGIVSQQLANEPGGNRWVSLADRSVDMLADHFEARAARRPRTARRTRRAG
jgi:AcrR family transcriptional regulator